MRCCTAIKGPGDTWDYMMNAPGGKHYEVTILQRSVARIDRPTVQTGMTPEHRPYYYTKIYADSSNPDVVWVQNQALLKSVDGGMRFTSVETPHSDTHDLWINPSHPNYMAQADDSGGTISRDGGRTWSTEDNQATGQFYRVNTDDRFPYIRPLRPLREKRGEGTLLFGSEELPES